MTSVFVPVGTALSVVDKWGVRHTALLSQYDVWGRAWVIDNSLTHDVKERLFTEFTNGLDWSIVNYKPAFSQADILQRAYNMIGRRYNPLFFNCQHFTSLCVTGKAKSEQLRGALTVAGLLLGAAVIPAMALS